MMQARVPSRTEHTSMRPGYDGSVDTSLASTRGRFTWHALDGAPICRPKGSPGEGRFLRSEEWGKIISPSSSSSSSSSSPKDSHSEGVLPPAPHAFAAARAMPLSGSFSFCQRCLSFAARLASRFAIPLGKVIPTGRCTCIQDPTT
jgi:hypothetical protein